MTPKAVRIGALLRRNPFRDMVEMLTPTFQVGTNGHYARLQRRDVRSPVREATSFATILQGRS
jgi:hypothetical protein